MVVAALAVPPTTITDLSCDIAATITNSVHSQKQDPDYEYRG